MEKAVFSEETAKKCSWGAFDQFLEKGGFLGKKLIQPYRIDNGCLIIKPVFRKNNLKINFFKYMPSFRISKTFSKFKKNEFRRYFTHGLVLQRKIKA